jgi:three-Cys-motif partner protein
VQTRPPLFSNGSAEPEEVDSPGSARLAAMLSPSFDRMVLIEKGPERFAKLNVLNSEFPELKIAVHNGDANATVVKLCRGIKWHQPVGGLKGFRGEVFLDPFGMEERWLGLSEQLSGFG